MNSDDQMLLKATPSVKNVNLLKIDQNSLNVYPKCCQNHTHSAIPQLYASEDVTDHAIPISQDKTFLFYYPDLGNIHIKGHERQGANLDIERLHSFQNMSTPERVAESYEGNVVKQEPAKPRGQHPGFILLSVKHERISNTQPAVRVVTGGYKATTLPQRKISRKRYRKVTPSSHTSDSTHALDFDLLSTGNALLLESTAKEKSPTSSRFRVTRIADSSSWWIPENPEMYICVHDLRTSSLPDFVTRQHQKVLESLSIDAANYGDCSRDFWNCLEPDYLQHVNRDIPAGDGGEYGFLTPQAFSESLPGCPDIKLSRPHIIYFLLAAEIKYK
ncbi:hypothetical protein TSMEX_002168 [Taenia solium]|eukprot:TsM_000779300 transcript=TsM_000779300 gene=TsM_000779300